MGRQVHIPSRAVIFLLIATAHGLLLWRIWNERAPMIAETETFTSVLFFNPDTSQITTPRAQAATNPPKTSSAAEISEFPARTKFASLRASRFQANRGEESTKEVQVAEKQNATPSFIDWVEEAEMAAADSLKRDAEISPQAMALSKWQSHAIQSLKAPTARPPLWDYSRTHRLGSSAIGLVVNVNDRCAILISVYLMQVKGGCKLGEPSVRGDLFMQIKDAPVSSEQAQ